MAAVEYMAAVGRTVPLLLPDMLRDGLACCEGSTEGRKRVHDSKVASKRSIDQLSQACAQGAQKAKLVIEQGIKQASAVFLFHLGAI